ncbi:MAG: RNA polymerase sigma factor [Myxococcales bacterium]|nr:RNA polymerase sigma factor [Myxococcales bacterium]
MSSEPRVDAVENDAELLRQVAAGDLEALGQLYDRYFPAVLAFCRRAAGQDAEDLAQETFLTAVRAAPNYDGREICRPWLLGIAARCVLHKRRSFARFQALLQRFANGSAAVDQRDPDLTRRLEQALAELPAAKRVVVILAEAEGLTGEEIAKQLGIPVGTVWTRLYHAKRQLRGLLGEEWT